MLLTAFATALITATPVSAPLMAATPPAQLQPGEADGDLAAKMLSAGREDEALAVLERSRAANPHDPAVLINLGIAYAHKGEDAHARAAFEAALTCHENVELDTAEGTTTNSRRLARKALQMLERGEFRSAEMRSDQLTYRE